MVDRDKLFITIRNCVGNVMDPMCISYSINNSKEWAPERLSKGIYKISENTVPTETDCIVWKIQESKTDKIMELRQKSDGDLQYNTPAVPIGLKWSNQDPRIEYQYMKRLKIVILRPSYTGGIRAGIGHVDNKETFSILTDFDDHRLIDVDETWDPSWKWIEQPKQGSF